MKQCFSLTTNQQQNNTFIRCNMPRIETVLLVAMATATIHMVWPDEFNQLLLSGRYHNE
jgi:hypothetical protein